MDIDQNIQTALVSCFSKRLLYLGRYVFWPFRWFGSCIPIRSALKPMGIQNNGWKLEPFKENSIGLYWKFGSYVDSSLSFVHPYTFLQRLTFPPPRPRPVLPLYSRRVSVLVWIL
jgi:hypothetical protein